MQRRTFLSVAAATLMLPAALEAAHAAPLSVAPPVPPVKPSPGATPSVPRQLDLVNAHSGARFSGLYRDANGPIVPQMIELSEFLRDTHCGEWIEMDVAALDFLSDLMAKTGQTSAVILSAYRTRATNEMLARTTFGVAENSQHIYGRALDVHFTSGLEHAMTTARAMKRGGVGWYPQSHFIHIDSGPVRNWDLDGGGLGKLLFDGRTVGFDTDGEIVLRRRAPGGRESVVLRGGELSVRGRMARLHELARAEFLARRHRL